MNRRDMFVAVAALAPFAACTASAPAPSLAAPVHAPLATIDYRRDGKLIMLPVRVNDRAPAWFTVDTGAPHSVIDPRLAADLGLTITHEDAVTGTGRGTVPVGHGGPVRLDVGGLVLPVDDPWIIDLSGVPIDPDVRGLLGADFFAAYIVRLDPDRGRFEVFDAATYSWPRDGATIPLVVERDRLFVDVRLDVKPGMTVSQRVRVDVGSEASVNSEIVRLSTTTRGTTLGGGLGADFAGVSGMFDAVHIGPYTIRQVWGPGGPGPAIGMEIFRRFVTTFDVPNGRLHLSPGRALDEPVPAPPA